MNTKEKFFQDLYDQSKKVVNRFLIILDHFRNLDFYRSVEYQIDDCFDYECTHIRVQGMIKDICKEVDGEDSILGVMITHLPTGLWIGIALAPVIGFSLSLLAALALYGKENFPWLVSENQDEQIMCYDFEITEENATALSQTLFRLFGDQGYSSRTRSLAGMLSEDILMLIKEKNPPGKKLFAECNVIFEKSGARVILRDSGIVFDVTACDGTHSLQEYIVAQTLNLSENKFYISTTGYNRNELLLELRDKSEAINE